MEQTFEIVTTTAGAISIRDNVTREIMHNPVGPWVEANSLYIEQCDLARRLGEDLESELIVFDVGLGAAANALATLHCARRTTPRRPLKLVSFERDLTLLEFALAHADQFPHFAGFEDAVRAMLATGSWREDGITWELRHGDFVELITREETPAHLVFYEPYSPKKNADMWNIDVFKRTLTSCDPKGCSLYTYSQATGVRVALLVAGFYVGLGVATGPKHETTLASTRLEDLANPLGKRWLERWERSHVPNASGAADEDLDMVRRVVRAHPQFAGL